MNPRAAATAVTRSRPTHRLRTRDGFLAGAWGLFSLAAISATLAAGGPAEANGAAAEPIDRPPDRAVLPTHSSRACVSCHDSEPVLSHPVDIAPSMDLPDHFPLENGRVTCLTCHEVQPSESHSVLATGNGALRGGTSGAAFCAECHTDQPSTSPHASSVTKAHLAWTAQHGPASTATSHLGGLDLESRTCMGCHDGSLATEAGGSHGGAMSMADIAAEHPVGVVYGASETRGWHNQIPLHAADSIDDRIRLFEGAIGCGTCHSPYSRRENHLVMSNAKSALCMSCHDY